MLRTAPRVNTCSATVLYTPGTNFNGTDSFTFTVNDGHVNSAAATISITVDPINDAPIFNAGVDQTVLEDSGATTVDGWATGISPGPTVDEAGQTVTFGVTNDNNPLFSVQPDVDEATGDLTFTVAPNAFGSAIVTVTLSDDGGTSNGGDDTSDSQTFTITVTAVNDLPSFTSGATVTVTEDSAPYSAGWATAISAGPNETGQTLAFVIDSNDNSALFTGGGQPAIASNGTLTFTLAPDAFGTATLSVRLTDNGGTANGGVDTTTAVSLTITINPINDAPTLAGGTTKSHDATAHLELTVTQNLLFDAADKANEVSAGSVLSARVANDPASAVLADGTELTTTRAARSSSRPPVSAISRQPASPAALRTRLPTSSATRVSRHQGCAHNSRSASRSAASWSGLSTAARAQAGPAQCSRRSTPSPPSTPTTRPTRR